MYRSSFMNIKANESKLLLNYILGYSTAKSTLQVTLTFIRLKETMREKFSTAIILSTMNLIWTL